MTRFAKVPEEVLDIVPNNLAYHYARLSAAREYDSGEVRAASWSELAALMKCSESGARRVVPRLVACGALKGDFPTWVLPHCVVTSAFTSDGTSDGTSAKRTYPPETQIPRDTQPIEVRFWRAFKRGHVGRPESPAPARRAKLTQPIADALGRGANAEHLIAAAERVGAQWRADGLSAPSRPEAVAKLVDLAEGMPVIPSREEWLNGG